MTNKQAKPFLKWAGGKSQLIEDIRKSMPQTLTDSSLTYIEPFVGSGAVLFWVLNNLPNVKKAVINDINKELTDTYITIKTNVVPLIKQLNKWEKEYHKFENDAIYRKQYYLDKRELFNSRTSSRTIQSALFIFLNRTCFNGLYRVNRSNLFNVPIGSYTTPLICDEQNLLAVNKVLQKVEILTGDFEQTLTSAKGQTFFYLDPPYKPLSQTSSFNSYAKDEFGDEEQIRLRDFCKTLDVMGHNWMLSNSDVKGKDINDDFFDDLYHQFNIARVEARRNINANGNKRGKLSELLITNYSHEQALQTT